MRVRRTGARRGQSPTWYIYADQLEEQAAIRAGLLQDRSPDPRYRDVVAWGFARKAIAAGALSRLRPVVERASHLAAGDLTAMATRMAATGFAAEIDLASVLDVEALCAQMEETQRGAVENLESLLK